MASILTNIGRVKLASATPEEQLVVSQIAVGDGNGGFPPITPDMTGLTNEVWRGTASNPIRSDDDNVLIFEGFIPANIGGFYVREVAIFDSDGDMIAIGNTSEVEKPDPNTGTAASLSVRLHIGLSSATQVDLVYDNNPTIDHSGLSNRGASDAHPASSISTEALPSIDQPESNLSAILGLLKKAALKDHQLAADDATAGVLLAVGAFGLGSTPVLSGDWNSINKTGFYRNLNTQQPELPAPWGGIGMIHIESTSTLAIQIAFSSNSSVPRTWRRSRSSGNWGGWVAILDSSTNHNDLPNRDGSGAHPSSSISTTPLSGLGVVTNSTVQAILGLLKSAAKFDAQSNLSDNQSQKLLKVGAFGLGGLTLSSDNWNNISVTGFYKNFSPSQPEIPEAFSEMCVMHIESVNNAVQICFRSNSDNAKTWRRSRDSEGWGNWSRLLDENDIQASTVDSNSEKLLKVGAFGLGDLAIISDDWNAINKNGFYRNQSASQPELPRAVSALALHHIQTTVGFATQTAFFSEPSQPRTWRRSANNGVWGPWVELHDSGNSDEVGSVKYFITTVSPSGRYIKANGAAVSRTAYADLFAKVGTFWGPGDGSTTFNVPDLRGEFIRTWDDGRGVDSGRSFGTFQADELKSHSHGTVTTSYVGSDTGTAQQLADDTPGQTGSTGGSETRPRNVALIAWIRY